MAADNLPQAGRPAPIGDGPTVPKAQIPSLAWLGAALACGFWLVESLLHAYVFGDEPLRVTLLSANDPNEIWMRVLTSVLFVAFGWIAAKSVATERHLKEDAQKLHHLLEFATDLKQHLPHIGGGDRRRYRPSEELAVSEDDIGRLTKMLLDLSTFLDERFKELYVLLQLTHQINMGLLLGDVLEKAYTGLRAILPYDRMSVALIDDDGVTLRAHWARADYSPMLMTPGFAGLLQGSSLQGVIASEEPRIINNLVTYLKAHLGSESTRLMVKEGIRSSLTCPLISAGRAIGFIFFSSRTPGTYESVHVEIFKLIAGHLSLVVEKSNMYQQILREKDNSESLLLNVIPARIAERLRAGEQPIVDSLAAANILFADIEGFTVFASQFPPEEMLRVLQDVFLCFDDLCDEHDVEKIKTIGDEYMAVTGTSGVGASELRKLAAFALDALASVGNLHWPDGQAVRVRIGMHCGPAVAGVIGQKKFAYDIWGDAVNTASRMESSGEVGRIQVTQEVYAQLRDKFVLEERGTIVVKGKGAMTTYFLTGEK